MPFNMKDLTGFLHKTKVIYSKFLLSLGFILFAIYSYCTAENFTLKAAACLAVGIAYLIYGIYSYNQERKKEPR